MIRWLTERLGTASFYEVERNAIGAEAHIVDVRELFDGPGNDLTYLRALIEKGAERLTQCGRVLVCCDMGVSRSNAVAIGILLATGTMTYAQAISRCVLDLGNPDISAGLLRDVRKLYEPAEKSKRNLRPRVLVTGATGFVGRHVCSGLKRDYDLIPLDRSQYDLSRDLLRLDTLVRDQSIDSVLHLAHPRMRSSFSALGEALVMLKTLLELCNIRGMPLIYLGGHAAYCGEHTAQGSPSPLKERILRGAYGETKYLCEQLISVYREVHGVRVSVLRPSSVYGLGLPRSHFMQKFVEWALDGVDIRTHIYRNGPPVWDFLHVSDLVAAIGKAIRLCPVQAVNVGTGVFTTTREIAQKIIDFTMSHSKLKALCLDEETSRRAIDATEALNTLGWRPAIGLDTGLKELCRAALDARGARICA